MRNTILMLAAVLLITGCKSVTNVPTPPPTPTPAVKTVPISGAPALLQGGGPTYSVPVRWQLYVGPASAIRVWLGSSPSSFNVAASVPPSQTSTTVGGLKKNQTYYFRLTAISTNKLESPPSGIIQYSQKGGSIPIPPAGSSAQ